MDEEERQKEHGTVDAVLLTLEALVATHPNRNAFLAHLRRLVDEEDAITRGLPQPEDATRARVREETLQSVIGGRPLRPLADNQS